MATPKAAPPRLLLVEGVDDEQVIWHICQRHGIDALRQTSGTPATSESALFEIAPKDGAANVVKSIEAEVNVIGRVALGIVIDADRDIETLWRQLTTEFGGKFGLSLPDAPDAGGTIVGDYQPRIGIWIMPDNASPGELENFAVPMIPASDNAWSHARRYIATLPDEDREFADDKEEKAELYAWLATRKYPRFIGKAIGDGYLDAESPLCRQFVGWLRRLFG